VDSSILSVVALNGIVEGMLVAIVPEIQSRYGIAQIAKQFCLMLCVMFPDELTIYFEVGKK
jgi:hypothetical protein